ncbi:MAG TPA: dihydrodipicolinate synthase family protein [Bryobacteraceae bacterium]|jgi:4-hydroxy-tetrahydrodipicolinate synthase|nr:dihydrodipicolinate synthase family protein [Bryobacteraceae bacterium]
MRVIEGVQALLSTPMSSDGRLDYESTFRLIDHVIAGGVHGIILLGSTGEFFSLSEAERREFAEKAMRYIGGRVPVGVCPGLAGTETTIDLARHAEAAGADYLLVPIPFYFANTLPGIVDFFVRVAASVSIPVMPYDGGGGNALDMEMWRRIVETAPNVRLAKITVPTPPKIKWLHDEFHGRVSAFGGSDQTVLLALANGARGLTVAGANVVPDAFVRVYELYRAGERDQARCMYYQRISPMNVIAVPAHTEFIQCYKQALYWMGIIASPRTRGPMMPLDQARKEELRAALTLMGVRMPVE